MSCLCEEDRVARLQITALANGCVEIVAVDHCIRACRQSAQTARGGFDINALAQGSRLVSAGILERTFLERAGIGPKVLRERLEIPRGVQADAIGLPAVLYAAADTRPLLWTSPTS